MTWIVTNNIGEGDIGKFPLERGEKNITDSRLASKPASSILPVKNHLKIRSSLEAGDQSETSVNVPVQYVMEALIPTTIKMDED